MSSLFHQNHNPEVFGSCPTLDLSTRAIGFPHDWGYNHTHCSKALFMKLIDSILRSKLFKTSLRFKVAFVFVLPMIFILTVLSYWHNIREQKELEEQVRTTTIQIGDMALSGMKQAMLRNDREVVTRIFNNIGSNPSIKQMWIVNPDFRIVESTNPSEIGLTMQTDQAGCVECHSYLPADRPRVTEMSIGEQTMRVVSPIRNEPECQACHPTGNVHLGVLIIDAPLSKIAKHIEEDRIYNIGISVLSILLVTTFAYMLIQWLIVKRVGVLYEYLNAFAAGDFSVRVPKRWRTEDEITRLADHFNNIADALERHEKEQREIAIIRQEAITEERERIARDLHDGIAQLLAYLNTKISAARLLLNRNRPETVDAYLTQMEEAVQKQATEVRAAIIGLKLIGRGDVGLFANLQDYVSLCNRLGDLRIVLDHASGVEQIRLAPETEIHLLRLTQEAVSNARRHASASEVRIHLQLEDGILALTIEDNGIGFDTLQSSVWQQSHFGLQTMGERADAIGAAFQVESAPNRGTRVSVRLKIKAS